MEIEGSSQDADPKRRVSPGVESSIQGSDRGMS